MMDNFGLILKSNINVLNSIAGKEIVGTYAADYIEPADVMSYLEAIDTCISKGYAHCLYTLYEKNWFCVMERLSDRRVRVREWCVEGMNLKQVLRLV